MGGWVGGWARGEGADGGEFNISGFSPLSSKSSFSLLSGGLFVEFVAAVQGHGTPKVRVCASLGSFCETPAAQTGN